MAELDRGHIDGLRAMYARALQRFKDAVECDLASSHMSDPQKDQGSPDFIGLAFGSGQHFWKRVLDGALKDFLYCEGWYDRRLCIADWFELETLIEGQREPYTEMGALWSETFAERPFIGPCPESAEVGQWDAERGRNANDNLDICIAESAESDLGLLYAKNFNSC